MSPHKRQTVLEPLPTTETNIKMKDLFDPILVEETKQRILELRPECARQWGSMAVAQTLAHCISGIEMAMGVIQAKRAPFPANLISKTGKRV